MNEELYSSIVVIDYVGVVYRKSLVTALAVLTIYAVNTPTLADVYMTIIRLSFLRDVK